MCLYVIDHHLLFVYTLSMSSAIKFSDERVMLVLIQANRVKFCPIAARIIAQLASK